ncbi:MAG TPA: hypothetical protein VFQ44_27845 [Streptosporangiaceae bacterium]|nr:hypothetical protein [Streptosporangiaceae bacterium]
MRQRRAVVAAGGGVLTATSRRCCRRGGKIAPSLLFWPTVFPFIDGHSFPFGRYTDERIRTRAVDLIAALHKSAGAVRHRALCREPDYAGR